MKRILIIVSIVLALLSPAIALTVTVFATPSQYEYTFLGELSDKYERLRSIDEPKVVLIGGSSVAFGYDTKMMEEHLGMPVVNFGLYATLGTKVMLDLSKESLGEGDVIVLAPEMDAQTLSLYFNGESVWQAADSDLSILGGVSSDNYDEMVGSLWSHLTNKLRLLLRDGKPKPDGIYSESSFDEHGDIIYERPGNIMTVGYQLGSEISLTPDMVSDDFIDYVNDYVAYATKAGASVYFSFSPMNASAMSAKTTEDSLYEFFLYLSEKLNCPIITNPNHCILEKEYFYDSNFHLNDAGTVVRTARMINDLRLAIWSAPPLLIDLPAPPPLTPPPSRLDDPAYSLDADCFLYEENEGGSLTVIGLTEEGKVRTELTVPAVIDGKQVTVLGNGATVFAGSSILESITVNENITYISPGSLDGCPSLRVVILDTDPTKTSTHETDLLTNVPSALRFRARADHLTSFTTDYYWSPYASRFDFTLD